MPQRFSLTNKIKQLTKEKHPRVKIPGVFSFHVKFDLKN
jgi:hypothetical protein